MSAPEERIVAAAIKRDDVVYTLPAPARHNDVIRMMVEQGVPPPISHKQGFVTSAGRFVDRTEAADIAYEAKQIPAFVNLLMSEDVW